MSWTSFPELTQVASHGDDLIMFETAGTPTNKYQKRSVLAAWLMANMNAALTALFGLTFASDKGIYATGASAFATYDLTAGGRALGGVAGTADTLPYFSASNTVSLAPITAAGRALLDDADAAAMRTTLGLAIGTDVQAHSAALAEFAGYSISSTLSVLLNGGTIPSAAPFFASHGGLRIARNGGAAVSVMAADGGVGWEMIRYSGDTGSATTTYVKSRGTQASPSAVAQNDRLGSMSFYGWDGGSAFRLGGHIRCIVSTASPGAADMHSRFVFELSPAGSVTPTEVARLDHATGLSMYGTNVVIDQDRGIQKRSRTVAELASLTPTAGREFYCSNESGGGVPVFGDGTNWRRVTDRAIIS